KQRNKALIDTLTTVFTKEAPRRSTSRSLAASEEVDALRSALNILQHPTPSKTPDTVPRSAHDSESDVINHAFGSVERTTSAEHTQKRSHAPVEQVDQEVAAANKSNVADGQAVETEPAPSQIASSAATTSATVAHHASKTAAVERADERADEQAMETEPEPSQIASSAATTSATVAHHASKTAAPSQIASSAATTSATVAHHASKTAAVERADEQAMETEPEPFQIASSEATTSATVAHHASKTATAAPGAENAAVERAVERANEQAMETEPAPSQIASSAATTSATVAHHAPKTAIAAPGADASAAWYLRATLDAGPAQGTQYSPTTAMTTAAAAAGSDTRTATAASGADTLAAASLRASIGAEHAGDGTDRTGNVGASEEAQGYAFSSSLPAFGARSSEGVAPGRVTEAPGATGVLLGANDADPTQHYFAAPPVQGHAQVIRPHPPQAVQHSLPAVHIEDHTVAGRRVGGGVGAPDRVDPQYPQGPGAVEPSLSQLAGFGQDVYLSPYAVPGEHYSESNNFWADDATDEVTDFTSGNSFGAHLDIVAVVLVSNSFLDPLSQDYHSSSSSYHHLNYNPTLGSTAPALQQASYTSSTRVTNAGSYKALDAAAPQSGMPGGAPAPQLGSFGAGAAAPQSGMPGGAAAPRLGTFGAGAAAPQLGMFGAGAAAPQLGMFGSGAAAPQRGMLRASAAASEALVGLAPGSNEGSRSYRPEANARITAFIHSKGDILPRTAESAPLCFALPFVTNGDGERLIVGDSLMTKINWSSLMYALKGLPSFEPNGAIANQQGSEVVQSPQPSNEAHGPQPCGALTVHNDPTRALMHMVIPPGAKHFMAVGAPTCLPVPRDADVIHLDLFTEPLSPDFTFGACEVHFTLIDHNGNRLTGWRFCVDGHPDEQAGNTSEPPIWHCKEGECLAVMARISDAIGQAGFQSERFEIRDQWLNDVVGTVHRGRITTVNPSFFQDAPATIATAETSSDYECTYTVLLFGLYMPTSDIASTDEWVVWMSNYLHSGISVARRGPKQNAQIEVLKGEGLHERFQRVVNPELDAELDELARSPDGLERLRRDYTWDHGNLPLRPKSLALPSKAKLAKDPADHPSVIKDAFICFLHTFFGQDTIVKFVKAIPQSPHAAGASCFQALSCKSMAILSSLLTKMATAWDTWKDFRDAVTTPLEHLVGASRLYALLRNDNFVENCRRFKQLRYERSKNPQRLPALFAFGGFATTTLDEQGNVKGVH
ncbi:hypothetical protein GGG16DRAFT_52766, partial [Schizophyllum commune]